MCRPALVTVLMSSEFCWINAHFFSLPVEDFDLFLFFALSRVVPTFLFEGDILWDIALCCKFDYFCKSVLGGWLFPKMLVVLIEKTKGKSVGIRVFHFFLVFIIL